MPAPPDPSFGAFASEWLAAKRLELRPATVAAYSYELRHLLRAFGERRLSEIGVRDVDRYRQAHLSAGLSPSYVNATLTRLSQILELAVEYELIARNPAAGRRRRVRTGRSRPAHLDG